MLIPNRHNSSNSYRYGFQGQEKDDELKGPGNSLNYEFRMHDPRVGRFFSRDPLSAKYPWNSPYVFSENRLIDGVELEGLEVELITMQARAGLYGKTVQKVVAGTQDGISESINQTYDFLTDSAWKTTTWKTIGNSLGQFLACPEPAFDRAQVDFDKKIINGDAYSRSKYISKGATDIATIYVGSKGANLLLSEALNISKISLLQKFSIAVPEFASLGDLEARVWYVENEAKIPNLIKSYSSLEKQAKAAFNLRNELRSTARDLMSNRKEAIRLMAEEPNMTWKQVVEKYSEDGKIKGDELFEKIIKGSQKSRPSVNKALGIKVKK